MGDGGEGLATSIQNNSGLPQGFFPPSVEAEAGATARFRTIQVYPKDMGAFAGHTRSVNRPTLLNDALGSKGERS
jgi:hypothetical protein